MRLGVRLGVFLLILGFAFALVSEITNTKPDFIIYSFVFGGLEFLIWIFFTPMYNKKAKKARVKNNTKGDSSFRIASWTLYTIGLGHGIMLFNWGMVNGGDNLLPDSMILVNAFMLLMASMFMFIDYQKSLK
tara:strand:+ start:315 stop:710 length:396 start_codon:yes stop_codon:yes gene_type:complete